MISMIVHGSVKKNVDIFIYFLNMFPYKIFFFFTEGRIETNDVILKKDVNTTD